MLRNNFHILSGGPGAGKTTLLEALRARGHVCVDEAARRILKEQARSGGNATHDGDRARYRDLMLEQGLRDYRAFAETAAPIFFDRAIPELSGYGNVPGEGDPPALSRTIEECRYNPRVFLFPPWEAIYVHDDLRKHSFAHAIETFENCRTAYRRHGYRIVEVPKAAVDARADFILREIDNDSRGDAENAE
ncbi:MAG: AAA family ATPase [Rhizomicrobium sp.]